MGASDGTLVRSGEIVEKGASYLASVTRDQNLDPGIRSAAGKVREEILGLAADRRLRLAVIGEFSSGKSTFINALLGVDILASDLEPTTAVTTRVTWGPAFQIRVRKGGTTQRLLGPYRTGRDQVARTLGWYRANIGNTVLNRDGSLRPASRTMASQFVRENTTEQGGARDVDEVVIEVPSPYLEGAIDILDTPGLNPGMSESDRRRHWEVTRRCVEEADLAIFLLAATGSVLKGTERRWLEEFRPHLSRTFFVVSRMDGLDEEEAEETELYVREELPEKLGVESDAATLYFVSALPNGTRGADKYRQNLARLRSDIVLFMRAARTQIVLERTSRAVRKHVEAVREHVRRTAEVQRRELDALLGRRIANADAMRGAVLGRATEAFTTSSARFVAEYSQFEPHVQNCVNALWQHLAPIQEKEHIETTFARVAGGIAQHQLITPMSKNLVEWLTWCVTQTLDAMADPMRELYAGMALAPPSRPTQQEISRLASSIAAWNVDGSDIAAALRGAREDGNVAAGFGAMGGAALGLVLLGPLGLGLAGLGALLGSWFGPSLDDLKRKALNDFAERLRQVAGQIVEYGQACVQGTHPEYHALVNRYADVQVRTYSEMVERRIAEHQKRIDHARTTLESLQRSATEAETIVKRAETASEGLRSSLRTRVFDTADEGLVLDDAAARIAAEACMPAAFNGGFDVPARVMTLFGGRTVPSEISEAVAEARALASLVDAAVCGAPVARGWCWSNAGEMRRIGISKLDLAVLIPSNSLPQAVSDAATLALALRVGMEPAEVLHRAGSAETGLQRFDKLQRAVGELDEACAFWDVARPPGLNALPKAIRSARKVAEEVARREAEEARLAQEEERRARRQRLWIGAGAAAAAIGGAIAVAAAIAVAIEAGWL